MARTIACRCSFIVAFTHSRPCIWQVTVVKATDHNQVVFHLAIIRQASRGSSEIQEVRICTKAEAGTQIYAQHSSRRYGNTEVSRLHVAVRAKSAAHDI